MNKKITAAVMAALMCVSLCTACGDSTSSDDTQSETAAVEETTAPAAETKVSITTQAVPTEPVDLEAGVTDTMYERAILNEGNKSRLAAAMEKAENGESITVGVIGGSITQGSLASSSELSYAGLFNQYWCEKFPNAEINYVNAGIGGTTSYLGVHRVDEQLLAYEPDVVIVEFSVNDGDKVMNKYSYDSLVRKILNCDSQPAVILLFTTMEDGTSLQDTHKEIGFAYDLPMISYHDVVYPEVAAGTLAWTDISPDNIHPNDAGHDIIGQLISRYLDSVYDELDSIDTSDLSFDTAAYTADYYADAKLYNATEIEATEMNGFEVGSNTVYPTMFTDNWVTTSGGSITFDVECKCFGLFYVMQTNGKGGTFEVYVDGQRKAVIDSDFSGGWGTYGETTQALLSKDTEAHTIEIKPAEGSEDAELTILALMMS